MAAEPLGVFRGHTAAWGVLMTLFASVSCGARDVGEPFERGVTLPATDAGKRAECLRDEDCTTSNACLPRACEEGVCVDAAPVVCDDGDPCTLATCAPATAECTSEPATPDADGDGHRAPLPGTVAGAIGSCGDDCDDGAASAYPGGVEVCDGLDNDCNGVTDDGYTFQKTQAQRLLVAQGEKGAESGGVVHTGRQYAFFVSVHDAHKQAQLVGFDSALGPRFRSDVSLTNSDTFAGGIAWTGQALAVAWEDRRDNDYEVYFNRFDTLGQKLNPDLRVSEAPGFSLDPVVHFTGTEFLVLWADGRRGSNAFSIFGRRIGLLGTLESEEIELTPDYPGARAPSLTGGETELGLVFNMSAPDGNRVMFRMLSENLDTLGPVTFVSPPNGTGGTSVFADGRYLIFWSEYNRGPGESIWGAVVSSDGELLQGARPLTAGGGFARSHSVLPLGDRVLLAWANNWGASYDLYVQTFSLELQPLDEVQQVTFSSLDVLGPRLTLASEGMVGLSYTERSEENGPRVWLETLSCR